VTAAAAPIVLTALDVLPDEHVTYRDENLTVPVLNKIMGAWAGAEDIERAQLLSPSLRAMFLEELSPLVLDETPVGSNGGFIDMSKSPLALVTSEKLNALLENTAVTYESHILVWLCDAAPSPIAGDIHTIRAVPDTAPTADVWTHSTLTFSQTLPAGDYAIVGAQWVEVGGIAARFMVPGFSWRPGMLANTLGDGEFYPAFRKGNWGKWLEFDFDNPPSVEMLSTGTDKGEFYIDMIQTRAGR